MEFLTGVMLTETNIKYKSLYLQVYDKPFISLCLAKCLMQDIQTPELATYSGEIDSVEHAQ